MLGNIFFMDLVQPSLKQNECRGDGKGILQGFQVEKFLCSEIIMSAWGG